MKKHCNILIVDDSPDDRLTYSRLIQYDANRTWTVFEAETGEDALVTLEEWPIDIVLLDYSLPGQNGLKVLGQLMEHTHKLGVIMLTGQGNERVAAEAMKNNAVDYIIKKNITEEILQQVLNDALERLAVDAKLAEQQESLKNYASVLTHDLKGPIQNIDALMKLIIQQINDKRYDGIKEFTPYLQKTTQHTLNLIKTLNAYNYLDAEDIVFKKVSMRGVVESAVLNLQSFISERDAEITYTDQLPEVHGNEPQLIQLLQNLLGNAIKYCHDKPVITIRCRKQKSIWKLGVQDNGIGMSAADCNKVFDMFTRLHISEAEFEGTGIGLATCKKIVERHQGKIWCQSKPGIGTTFYFTLPQQVGTTQIPSTTDKIRTMPLTDNGNQPQAAST